MILTLGSVLLSVMLVVFGWRQGRVCFGAFGRAAQGVQNLASQLQPTVEGQGFRTVVHGLVQVQDPIASRIARDLSRLFQRAPLSLENAVGWPVDLEQLCDAKRHAKRHPMWNKLEAMPGLFTGAGILFTFLGLAIGIYGLNPTDADQLTASVQQLLGGMSMAFLTSIAGIGIALWWTWRAKIANTELEAAFAGLAGVLREKTFLILPGELDDQLLRYQAKQTAIMGNLDESVFRAFERALSGHAREMTAAMEKISSAQKLEKTLAEIATGLQQLGKTSAENGEINRKLNVAINRMVKQSAELTSGVAAQAAVTDSDRVITNIGQIHQAQSGAIGAIRTSAEELKKLIETSHQSVNELTRAHHRIHQHLERLDRHWQSYQQQLVQMSKTLDQSLEGFGQALTESLTKVHGTFDEMTAESLQRFSGALKELQDTMDGLAILIKTDEETPRRKGIRERFKA